MFFQGESLELCLLFEPKKKQKGFASVAGWAKTGETMSRELGRRGLVRWLFAIEEPSEQLDRHFG
jgi:hypothetical protein